MSSFVGRDTHRKPEDIDITHREVNELTIQSTNWTGLPLDLFTVPIDGVEQIEIIQTFVSGVGLTAGVPTHPWFDVRLNGIPNNKLAGDTAVIRLYNTGERTLTTHTNRVVFKSNNPKGQQIRSANIEFVLPSGVRAAASDVGAWSLEFRLTRVGGLRM